MRVTGLFWGIVAAAVAGFGAAALFLDNLSWPFVAAGWLVAALNALAARAINRRAVGLAPRAFVVWGIIMNATRMLTVFGIFAYVILSCGEPRGGFLMSSLVGFFILMPIEVAGLFSAPTPRSIGTTL